MAMTKAMSTLLGAGAVMALLSAGAGARAMQANGYGPDPDGDGNPATNTRLTVSIGDSAEAAFDPPFRVVTFEAPPGGNGDFIHRQYENKYGVTFSPGVTRQICQGRRYFRYDSQCTYLRAPSGRFAALYRDDWGRPLEIRFKEPACIAALSLYPTGGAEGERYRVTLQPYAADGTRLQRQRFVFTWTNDTFRWRLMAEQDYLGERATRLDVNIESLSDRDKIIRFLMDDVATISGGDCAGRMNVAASDASVPPPPQPNQAPPQPTPASGS